MRFDITDYGAILDDSFDCGPAISAAIDDAIANGGGVILHPGMNSTEIARVSTGINPKNANVSLGDNQGFYSFAGNGGTGGVYRLDTLGSTSLFNIANASNVHIHDLIILPGSGTDHTGSFGILDVRGAWTTIIERVNIFGCYSTSTAGMIFVNNTHAIIRDCFLAGNRVDNTGMIAGLSPTSFVMDNCRIVDYHVWKGVGYNKVSGGNAKHWVELVNTFPREQCSPKWKIQNCFFDENTAVSLLKFDGNDTITVELDNIFVNGGYGFLPSIIAENCRKLKVKGMEFGGLVVDPYTTMEIRDTPILELEDVMHDYGARDIELYGTSKHVRIKDCYNINIVPDSGVEPIIQIG